MMIGSGRRPKLAVAVLAVAGVLGAASAVGAAVTVTPNGGWAPGSNAVVVQGPGTSAEVAEAILLDSGQQVESLWVMFDGSWLFFLPANPGVPGGLDRFPETPAAAIAVLADAAPSPETETVPEDPAVTTGPANYDILVVLVEGATGDDIAAIEALLHGYDEAAAIHVQEGGAPIIRARLVSALSGLCPILEAEAELKPFVADLACGEFSG